MTVYVLGVRHVSYDRRLKLVLMLVAAMATAAAGCGDHRGKQPLGSPATGHAAGEMRITETRVPSGPSTSHPAGREI